MYVADVTGRRRRSPLSLRGSVDFGGSDTTSEASSWLKGPSFASVDNLQTAAQTLQTALRGYGLSGKVNFLAETPEDVAQTLNCVHHLLQKLQREQLFRDDAQAEHRRIKSELQTNELYLHRLKKEIEAKEGEIANLSIRDRRRQASHEEELAVLIRDRDNLQKHCNNLTRRQIQFQHEIRRKELQYEWLQEKLRRYLAERKKDSATSMEIVGKLRQQHPQQERGRLAARLDDFVPGRNSASKKTNRAPKLDETMVKMIVTAYEEKQKELSAENKDLQEALNSIRKEYASMMNAQLQGTDVTTRGGAARSNSNVAKIFTTKHDRIEEETAEECEDSEDLETQKQSSVSQRQEGEKKNPPLHEARIESFQFKLSSSVLPGEREDSSESVVFVKGSENRSREETESSQEKSEIVPWPMNTEAHLRRQSIQEAGQEDSLNSKDLPSVVKSDEVGIDSRTSNDSLNAALTENRSSLPTVSEEHDGHVAVQEGVRKEEEKEGLQETDKQISLSTVEGGIVPVLEKSDDLGSVRELSSKDSTPASNSSLSTLDEKATEEVLTKTSSQPKVEASSSVEGKGCLSPSPFEITDSMEVSSTELQSKGSKFSWPPPSPGPGPKEDRSPRRRLKAVKIPEPSSKPVPNAAHLSEEQLRKELRTRAVDVEESVRALKTACTSMNPQDMRSVMERRLYMEFTMAANLAEQQEAVVNLAVAGLEKAKRLGPASEADWDNAAQAVTTSVESSEKLVDQMTDLLSSNEKLESSKLSSLLQLFQGHLLDIKKEMQGARDKAQERLNHSTSLSSSIATSRTLDKDFVSLRERADGLTKEKELLSKVKGNLETDKETSSNVHSTPPRRKWSSKSSEEPVEQKPTVEEDSTNEGYFSDEDSGNRNLSDILKSKERSEIS